ncbi:2-acyl-glycerophospho-ethanolamine acyltransferase [Helicobacter enhydrae]|uniref:2-acyl-glycerophospho-ethanolamine acyltransferase n=2 Tax=Helicobacter enhydrae TaxID=222136 RepID=A0A1B1U761_9HELI|nr:acyl-[ACP]--phospholipid O-acyltransferase [Helicobacter enhydrae]ANV98647.1 2-acyl-glycerophospho-ethanolamine acyltransferase [Helicobacter enhydrae]
MQDLLKIKGFFSFLLIGFLNTLIHYGHIVILANTIYQLFVGDSYLPIALGILAILPFLLFSSLSSFVTDTRAKAKVIIYSSLALLCLSILTTLCYYNGSFWLAFCLTFLFAIQSAFFLPAKLGYIKELVGNTNLGQANSCINAANIFGVFLAFLLFSVLFHLLFDNTDNQAQALQSISAVGFLLIALASLEVLLTYALPIFQAIEQTSHFDLGAYMQGTMFKTRLANMMSQKTIWAPLISLAVYCFALQIYIVFSTNSLSFSLEAVSSLPLSLIGTGICIGYYVVYSFSRHYLELGLVPFGLLLTALSSLLFLIFDTQSPLWLYLLLGVGFGLFVIPLTALIQFQTHAKHLGNTLATALFFCALALFACFVMAIVFSVFQINPIWAFGIACVLILWNGAYLLVQMPFLLVRLLVTLAFNQRYRLMVEGFEHIPTQGGALLLGNHLSFIDWAIVQMAIPRRVYFAMEHNVYSKWYIKWFLDRFGIIAITPSQEESVAAKINQYLENGEIVCLFPEGSVSKHGHLNEFKESYETICQSLNPDLASIIPFYIRGLWGSSFSRSSEQFQARNHSFFSKRNITIAFGESVYLHTPKEKLKSIIFDLSFQAWRSHCKRMPTLGHSWINTAKANLDKIAIVDSISGEYSYRKLLALTLLLAQRLRTHTDKSPKPSSTAFAPRSECIGILLPASFASTLCNLAILLASKVSVNLNFTSGAKSVALAIEASSIRKIFTSKTFLDKLSDKGIIFDFGDATLIYMEDLAQEFKSQKLKILGYLLAVTLTPSVLLKRYFSPENDIDSVATILFSSGSEGTPKGVMLNHLNIMSNIHQISDVLCVQDDDAILSSLPPFHAFGLTVTTFLPLLTGIPSITHPDPTDALGIAKAIAKNEVTIMCGTSTFLNIYTRSPKVESAMFETLRVVVSGAEKLKEEIRKHFESKFHIPILEGYGATETTPVVSVNLPNKFDAQSWHLHTASKQGSVGMPLPGTTIRIVDPHTLEALKHGEDGLILVGGHQVMVGYLNDPQKTDEVIVQLDGIRWYKTGDKGHIDCDGFLYITDRYSRFAKIGGEMVSLGRIEEEISVLLAPYERFAQTRVLAIALDDSKKGEAVVLLIQTQDEATYQEAIQHIKASSIPALYKPSQYFLVETIPLLGSGKTDFKGAKDIALRARESSK